MFARPRKTAEMTNRVTRCVEEVKGTVLEKVDCFETANSEIDRVKIELSQVATTRLGDVVSGE